MKKMTVTLAILGILGAYAAHADNGLAPESLSLNGVWNEVDSQRVDSDSFEIANYADTSKRATYVEEITRQVGGMGDGIPYETDCRYRQIGKLMDVSPIYITPNKPPQLTIQYCVQKVILVKALKTPQGGRSEKCGDFVKQQNARIKKSGCLSYTRESFVNSDGSLQDTWSNAIFKKQAPASKPATKQKAALNGTPFILDQESKARGENAS